MASSHFDGGDSEMEPSICYSGPLSALGPFELSWSVSTVHLRVASGRISRYSRTLVERQCLLHGKPLVTGWIAFRASLVLAQAKRWRGWVILVYIDCAICLSALDKRR